MHLPQNGLSGGVADGLDDRVGSAVCKVADSSGWVLLSRGLRAELVSGRVPCIPAHSQKLSVNLIKIPIVY